MFSKHVNLFTTSYCLRSPILWSVFLSLWSVIFKATNANPQPALFRVTNIWRNATSSAVRYKSFTFYKVVWWHFSGMVGKGVTVCFFVWYNINNLYRFSLWLYVKVCACHALIKATYLLTYLLKYVWIIQLKMTFLDFPR